jgi:hypothetical protein
VRGFTCVIAATLIVIIVVVIIVVSKIIHTDSITQPADCGK